MAPLLIPLKSRVLGIAILISLSKNACMRAPRNVTVWPTVSPWRTLNVAMDFLAPRADGFCPVIFANRSGINPILFLSLIDPIPVLTTTLMTLGDCILFTYPNAPFSASNAFNCFSFIVSMILLYLFPFTVLNRSSWQPLISFFRQPSPQSVSASLSLGL